MELDRRGTGRVAASAPARNRRPPAAGRSQLVPLSGETESAARIATGLGELDRVTGGGFVMGSAVLVGGDPGIGKSTLLLQAAAALAERGKRVVYVSGEEAVGADPAPRAAARARRPPMCSSPARPMSRSSSSTLQQGPAPHLVIIDSIQTLWTDRVDSAPGTVTQVRTSAQALTRFAKKIRRRGGAGRPRHQGRPDRRPARRRAHGRRGALFRGRRQPHLPHPARRQEPLRRDRRDRRVRDDDAGPAARSPTPRPCSSTSATRTPPARRSSPAWRARGRCCAKSRRWSRPRRSARHAAPWSAGTRRGFRWCWRCSRRAAASASAPTTSISTSRAG